MNLLEMAGAQPQKQPKYAPLFMDRMFTGLFTQRAILHDPADLATARFYGGRPDALIDGSNVELTNRLTLQRRPGLSAFSSATYPTPPDRAFSFELTNGTIQVVVDTASAVYVDNQDGTKTLLFDKSSGAGQGYFVAVAGILYIGDGVDTRKYTPGNPNGTIWNWGIAAPTSAPTATVVAAGAAATTWSASTFFSTMGLISATVGGTSYTFQLTSVNANPNNPNTTPIGDSGTGQPGFASTYTGTTSDGSVTWYTANGPITLWAPHTNYSQDSIVFDPVTGGTFYASHNFGFTSGASRPNFNTAQIGNATSDGGGLWRYLGGLSLWQPSHAYTAFPISSGPPPSSPNQYIANPVLPSQANLEAGELIYVQLVQTGGTSAASFTQPNFNIGTGFNTQDNQLNWICLGPSAWQASTVVTAWATQVSTFTAIIDSNGNWQVCIVGGTTAGSHPTWNTAYGDTTIESTGVQWVCVGSAADSTWVASSDYYLPTVGFTPPSVASPYGSASVVDSNGDVEFVVSSGFSGSGTPSWGAKFATTTDNQITWYNIGAFASNSITWQTSHTWAYSFKTRTSDDTYVTTAPPGAIQPNTPGPLGPYTGAGTGDISTASPTLTLTGAQVDGAVVQLSGLGSTDPQVDTIVIWRDADGGGPDNMFELTEIKAPAPIAGVAQPWTFFDFLPDLPTSQFPGLNNLIPAPIDDQNDPPPSDFLPMVYNFQRIWGASGQQVLFSGGPDVLTGNPNSAFNPADEFPYLASVVRVVKGSAGLAVFLTDSIEFIAGGPLTSSFYSVTLAPGIGLMSYNALDIYTGELYFVSADGQFYVMTPSLNVSNAGFAIADKIQAMNPADIYVAVLQSGTDNCLFVADGSTGWYRLNPRQVPGGSNGPEPIWSPFANITGGCKMVQTVETSPGIKKLLVGSTSNNQSILKRDLTVYTDNGTQYDAWFTMGSIVLCHPGQLALLKFIECDFSGFQYTPTVSYLLNEIQASMSAPFVAFTSSVYDPPSLYGTTITPQSYSPNRYRFLSNGSLARCRHLQIKVDFGTTSNGDEIYNLTIYGRLTVEE